MMEYARAVRFIVSQVRLVANPQPSDLRCCDSTVTTSATVVWSTPMLLHGYTTCQKIPSWRQPKKVGDRATQLTR